MTLEVQDSLHPSEAVDGSKGKSQQGGQVRWASIGAHGRLEERE